MEIRGDVWKGAPDGPRYRWETAGPTGLFSSLGSLSAGLVLSGSLAALLLVGIADFLAPGQVSLAVFNVIPVFVATMRLGRKAGFPLATLAAFSWFLSEVVHREAHGLSTLFGWDLTSRLLFFWVIAELAHQLRKALELARHEGRTDPLTGLLNRRAFFELAEAALRRSRESSDPLAVAYVDVDDFKTVNDALGHETGDTLLRALGLALRSSARSGDVVARLGGDEFAVLLPSTGLLEARAVGCKLEALIAETLASTEISAGASIGVSVASGGTPNVDALLHAADSAMFHAKRERKENGASEGAQAAGYGAGQPPSRRRADG
ncbi:MAG: GGDEF domain-containing protein [Holophagales bacterium]|nr:GGDEF domain-containing protein [Holophagales bacterium]